MYTYKIKIMKISGRLNESVGELPKVLSYKSKQKLNERDVFNKASKYIRSKYGVVLEMADITGDAASIDPRTKLALKSFVQSMMSGNSDEAMRNGQDSFVDVCIDAALGNPSFKHVPEGALEAAVRDIAEDCWYEEEYRGRQERWADKHYGEPEPDMLDDEWEW